MRALQCRNGHLCFSASERPDGSCPECGDESFSLVTVKEKAEEETEAPDVFVGKVVTAIDGSVVAVHKKRRTGYTTVVHGHGGVATVTTEAGSKHLVHVDSIEFLSEGE